jgi:hypothetical protein
VLVADDVVFTKAALDDFLSFQQVAADESAADEVAAADVAEDSDATDESDEEKAE